MPEVRIISRLDIPDFQAGGKVRVRTQITYVLGIQPPRTIYIDKQDPTEDEVIEALRADQAQPETPGTGILNI